MRIKSERNEKELDDLSTSELNEICSSISNVKQMLSSIKVKFRR